MIPDSSRVIVHNIIIIFIDVISNIEVYVKKVFNLLHMHMNIHV